MKSPEIKSHFRGRPEVELLLMCTRTRVDEQTRHRMQCLAELRMDWTYLLELAERHRITVLLERALDAAAIEPPIAICDGLRRLNRAERMRSLLLTAELLRIVQLLERSGIPCIPFKGPVLGSLVYGDPSLRPCLDLDLLIRRRDLQRTKQVLTNDAYRSRRALGPQEEAQFWKTQMGYELINDQTDVVVELHWAFLNRVHAFDMDVEEVWRRSVRHELAGVTLRGLAPEDLLLYLCAHGAKSFWARLSWICDISELLRQYPALEWQSVLAEADALHAARMLHLGLGLAQNLMGAELPEEVRERLIRDRVAARMASKTTARVLQLNPTPLSQAAKASYHLQMRERLLDRIPYFVHLVRLVLEPSEQDRSLISLPASLSALYYLVKPFRVVISSCRPGN